MAILITFKKHWRVGTVDSGNQFCLNQNKGGIHMIHSGQHGTQPSLNKTNVEELKFAGLGKRFLAAIIDTVILIILLFLIYIMQLILPVIILINANENSNTSFLKSAFYVSKHLVEIFLIIVPWFYSILFESSRVQATIGKLVLGIKVTNLEGKRISLLKACIRYLGKIFTICTFLIGFIIVSFTKYRQSLHDYIARTYVINK